MTLQVQCTNPLCLASFESSVLGGSSICPSCGSEIGTSSTQGLAGDPVPPTVTGGSLPWDLANGSMLNDRFQIVRKLGKGGMGAVYLAVDTRLGRQVALKVPSPQLYEDDPNFLSRLLGEAQIAANLRHPRICGVHDIETARGQPYIVMDFVAGRTLSALVKERVLPIVEAFTIVQSLAETLAYAHARNVIHRDLKPSNVMIDQDGHVIVIDLGLAKKLDSLGPHRTSTGQFVGTLAYAAPEQVMGRSGELGPACDIYALGVIAYELVTGQVPFRGGYWHVRDQILNDAPARPMVQGEPIDSDAEALLIRALSKAPNDRHSSMADLAAALASLVARLSRPTEFVPPTQVTPERTRRPDSPTDSTEIPTVTSSRTIKQAPFVSTVSGLESPPAHEVSNVSQVSIPIGVVPTLIFVPPGEFVMGSADGKADEKPPRKIQLTRGFYLGTYPVTQSEYETATRATPSHFRGGRQRNPVEQVSWFDAILYCNSLSQRAGLPVFYSVTGKDVAVHDWAAPGFRLPTEAEWEYACRASRTAPYGCGDETRLDAHAWYLANSKGRSHAVGGKSPNRWGFHDMHGNVAEWCWDWYDSLAYKKLPTTDPFGPDMALKFRVVRGGNWQDEAVDLRAARRFWFEPSVRLKQVGFRVARNA